MPSPRVHIQLVPRPRRIAHSRWDSESSTFTCAIEPADQASPEPDLRARLDSAMGLDATERRATLGNVDMLLDEVDRPISIEFYSNPARWTSKAVESGAAPQVADVVFELGYDRNGIASVDVPVSIEYDAASATLTMRFSEDTAQWIAFAEGMSIGVSQEQRLAAIRFQPFVLTGMEDRQAPRA